MDAAAIVQVDLRDSFISTEVTDNSPSCSRRERLSADPRKAAALQRARRKIARELDATSAFSLAKLRLNAGLSQVELAKLIGTQQPGIARLEKGLTEPVLSTIEKLAEAFGVSPETVLTAFINTKHALGKK